MHNFLPTACGYTVQSLRKVQWDTCETMSTGAQSVDLYTVNTRGKAQVLPAAFNQFSAHLYTAVFPFFNLVDAWFSPLSTIPITTRTNERTERK